MVKRVFQGLAIAMAVSLVAVVGFTAGAAGQPATEDSGTSDVSLWQRLHSVGARLHQHGSAHGQHGASGDFGHHARELVSQLDLSSEQAQRFEAILQTFDFQGHTAQGSMAGLHDQLVEQFEQGYLEPDAVRPMIEQHLEEIRTMAYSVTDEFVALANSLDQQQREIVLEHLQAAREARGGNGAHGRHGH